MSKGKYEHLRSSLDLLIGPDPRTFDLLEELEELEEFDRRKESEGSLSLLQSIEDADRQTPQSNPEVSAEGTFLPQVVTASSSDENEEVTPDAELITLDQENLTQPAADKEKASVESFFGGSEPSLSVRVYAALKGSNLDVLTKDASPIVRAATASHLKSFQALVRDDFPEVRAAVATHSTLLQDLQLLAADGSLLVRKRVAENPAADPATLMLLSGDASLDVVYAVLKNPNCPRSLLVRALSASNADIVSAALSNPTLTEDELSKAWPQQELYRHLFTRTSALPEFAFAELVQSSDASLRLRSIMNSAQTLPESVVSWCFRNGDSAKEALASATLDLDTLSVLLKDDSARVRRSLALHQKDAKILLELSADAVPLVRQAVASNRWSSPEVLAVLATDDGVSRTKRRFSKDELDGDVEPLASQVAQNPHAQGAALDGLLGIPDPTVVWNVSQHPNAAFKHVVKAISLFSSMPNAEEVWAPSIARTLTKEPEADALENLAYFNPWEAPPSLPQVLLELA